MEVTTAVDYSRVDSKTCIKTNPDMDDQDEIWSKVKDVKMECSERDYKQSKPIVDVNEDDDDALRASESPDGGREGSENENKKRRRRRRHKGGKHHRRWKPYNKLSWTERRELEEKESQRATQKREDAFASGHPVAPYNTTQFLMNDHTNVSPHIPEIPINRNNSRESKEGSPGCSDSSEEFYGSSSEDEKYLNKEFAEAYENIHAERLQTMSKDELIKNYLEMEEKLDVLEKQPKKSRESSDGQSLSSCEESCDIGTLKKYEEENKTLKNENEMLKTELEKIAKTSLALASD